MQKLLAPLVRLGALSLLLLSVVSCTSIPQPAEEWVTASRQMHDLIAPRFVAYVQADESLLPPDKLTLIEAVEDWDLMIQAGESLYPPAPATDAGGDE